ncbi:MAG: hypothetical protein IT480_14325 [Gammaproteobacteria bacterium]|nr:hypothetical protein [Gammaproteobacteria bacterium]
MSRLIIPPGLTPITPGNGCLTFIYRHATHVGTPFMYVPVPDGPPLVQMTVNQQGGRLSIDMIVRYRNRLHRNWHFRKLRGK